MTDRQLEGRISHPCAEPGCEVIVAYDDEPYCFTHSPDEGSSVRGYSYRATHSATQHRFSFIIAADTADAAWERFWDLVQDDDETRFDGIDVIREDVPGELR